ncbi:hypothetical protein Dsin_004265 [Dipteronia sinensis]|uniref:Uncharacterized protein n=1 Tax=Dipteronia sinensis TaxID=43782 RepID=A0AAE0BB23_9ROSI|nr:hypothetical protein Dsin_004265 [Dipteronia sinensis]
MDTEMETTSSFYDLEDLSIREQFRCYGKRLLTSTVSPHQESSVSKFSEPTSIHNPTNTALILKNIKQEVESTGFEGTLGKMQSASKGRSSVDSLGFLEADVGIDSNHRLGSQSLKACKLEDLSLIDSGETTFAVLNFG